MPRIKRMSRRVVLASGAAWTALYGARGQVEAQTPSAEVDAAWSFTDDRDIIVTTPEAPSRVVAQISAAAALWDYGVRPIAVYGPRHLADGAPDPRIGNVDLEEVESAGELWEEFDLERVLALDADLIVAPMWESPRLWYISEDGQAALEEKLPTIGILTAKTSARSAIERFAELAATLGADMESGDNATAREDFESVEAELIAAIADNPDLRVMMAAGTEDGCYVAHPDFMTDLWYFRDLGMNIVANGANDFWEDLSWEDVHKYPADLILIDERSGTLGPDGMAEIATWASVPAVKAGQVVTWNAEPTLGYASYAESLRHMAELVRTAKANLA